MTAKQELAAVRRQLKALWDDYNYDTISEDFLGKLPNDQRPELGRRINELTAREVELEALVAKLERAVGPRSHYVR